MSDYAVILLITGYLKSNTESKLKEVFKMTTYAVTGITGKFGSEALKTLTQFVSANDIIGIARNVEKAQAMVPAGVTVRQGDYSDKASMVSALAGVDKLLFVSSQPGAEVPRQQQHQNVIDAAKSAGVSYVAYTSYAHIETAKSPLADDHRYTEKAIMDAGLAHSFLRNNWYLENDLAPIQSALKGQQFVYAGTGRVGWAAEKDYAQAAAKVMTLTQPKDIYEFAGAPRYYSDLAEVVKTVSDRSFEVQAISEVDYQKSLEESGMDAGTAAVVTSLQSLISSGDLDEDNQDLPDVLGRPLTDLAEVIKANQE